MIFQTSHLGGQLTVTPTPRTAVQYADRQSRTQAYWKLDAPLCNSMGEVLTTGLIGFGKTEEEALKDLCAAFSKLIKEGFEA
jgi:hypothetical protein